MSIRYRFHEIFLDSVAIRHCFDWPFLTGLTLIVLFLPHGDGPGDGIGKILLYARPKLISDETHETPTELHIIQHMGLFLFPFLINNGG